MPLYSGYVRSGEMNSIPFSVGTFHNGCECASWISENHTGLWTFSGSIVAFTPCCVFYFENQEDAVTFALKFG